MSGRTFLSRGAIAFILFSIASLLPLFAYADTNQLPSFSQNLSLWEHGSEVQQLQHFLNAQGFLIARSGPGSPGHETTLFGILTYRTLLRYQAAHHLPATGYFGPLTRASAVTAENSAGANGNSSSTSSGAGSTHFQTTNTGSSTAATIPFVYSSSPGYGGGGASTIAPSCGLTAASPTITLGNSSLLTWSSTNAASASLSGVGSVGVASSHNVTPNTTTNYMLTVTSSTGVTGTCNATVTVIGSGDTTPPSVTLTAPANGATIGGIVTLTATATDNVAVADVQFRVGNTNIGSTILSAPYTTTWNTTIGTSTPDGTYTLNAVAADTSGNLATSSITVTVRNASPVISSIASSTSYTSATTTWTTDEASNSKVVYGLTTSYGSASSSASLVTLHSIILSGLTASTTYHFAVVSTDAGGNTSTSTDQTLATLATSTPPVISAISSGTPTTTAATITWNTDQSSNSEVVWGLTTGYGSASSSAGFVTSHSISLSGLATSTAYHYAVVSTNVFGATATSSDQTFTTASGAPDTTAPTTPTGLTATAVSSSQINLSWTASTDNGGGDAVTGYQVFRDGTQVATSSTNSYSDTGLQNATLHSYWIAAVDTAGNVSTSTGGTVAQTSYGADQYGTTWKPLRIGAGGYITGIDIASDGTKVIRTDTHGAYLWDGTQWDQLISTSSMPVSDVQINVSPGVYEIRIAPSNTNRFYMMFKGYVYRSDNRGATWTKTNLTQFHDASNESYRTMGERMAIDPNNANIVVVGTPDLGTWMSSDTGSTWTHLTALGTSTQDTNSEYYGETVAFDPTSSVVGGKTQGIYVGTYGTGIYHSTDGGGTWTLLNSSGMPTQPVQMTVAQDGVVYVSQSGTPNIAIYSSGAWSSVNAGTGGNDTASVAVDPSNANIVIALNDGGDLSVSTNHAASFSGVTNNTTRTATDIPWLAWTKESFMSAGNIMFDPTQTNKLYFAEGIGVWDVSPTSTETSVPWVSQSKGIEQLVANEVISPPGGYPVVASWDRPTFTITNPDVFPSTHGPNNANAIVAGWSLDYASNDPSYIAALDNFGSSYESGYSTDGGLTWNSFASQPAGQAQGGSIAAASSTDIVWFPSDNSVPYYSTDGGQSWTLISMAGVPTSVETGWGFAYYLDRQIVAADRVNIGTFYAYNYGPSAARSAAGVYKSTDGGVTWTQVYSGEITLFSGYNAKLRTVPGIAGELFFTGGQQSPDSLGNPANEQFMKSTDGGSTWTAVPNVLDVYDFGFGKAAPGTTTPAIYIVGFVNNQYGIWESDDNANTWTQSGLFPFNHLDAIKTISGDMNAYGRIYVGFSGSGYAYGNTTNAQIPPIITAISSGTPTTTNATITWTTDQSSNSEIVYGTTSSYGAASSSITLVTSHSITLTGLSSGTTYHYAVVSADAQGYTSTSTDRTFTTFNPTPPSTPTGLTATATSSSEIDLSWSASTGNGTYPVAGYKIYRNSVQVATDTSGTTFNDTGLAAYTNYTYTVEAYDTDGNMSAQSSSTNATTTWGVTFTPTAAPAIQWLAFGGGTTTFPTINIGSATSSRIVVVGVVNDAANGCCGDGGTTAVTIGGISATEAAYSDTSTTSAASLWYLPLATGTSTDIQVYPGAAAVSNVGILVGIVTGASASAPSATSTHPGVYNGNVVQTIPTSGTVSVPTNGVAVLYGTGSYNASEVATWTNTSSATGDYINGSASGNGIEQMVAHSYATGAQSFGVSGSPSTFSFGGFSGVMAAWGP